jgi:hypothetical protein
MKQISRLNMPASALESIARSRAKKQQLFEQHAKKSQKIVAAEVAAAQFDIPD